MTTDAEESFERATEEKIEYLMRTDIDFFLAHSNYYTQWVEAKAIYDAFKKELKHYGWDCEPEELI